MAIEFNCPACDAVLRAKEEFAGRKTRCPHCGEPARVPEFADAADAFALEPDPEPELEPASRFESAPAPTPASGSRSAIDDFLDGGDSYAPAPPVARNAPRRPPRPAEPPEEVVCSLCGTRNDGDATHCRGCGEPLTNDYDGAIVPTPVGFQDSFQAGWDAFAENMGPCIGGYLLSGLLYVVAFGLGITVMVVSFSIVDAQVDQRAVALAVLGLFALFNTYLYCFLYAGQLRFFCGIAAGEQPDFSLLLKGFPYTGRVMLILLAYAFMVTLGTLFFVVPGVYLALVYFPAPFVAVDRDVSTFEAFGIAGRITSQNRGMLFGQCMAMMAMFTAAGALQGLGMIIVGPFTIMLCVVVYRMMAGLPVADGK